MPERPQPITTVDVALFTLRQARLCVLLARRAREPFAGSLALPGGFVHVEEDDDAAATARRVLRDKAGLTAPYLEQLESFTGKFRDPRGWSCSIAYYAVVPEAQVAAVLGEDVVLAAVDELPALPFDHAAIIAKGAKRLRGKSSYSSLPTYLLPEMFTLNELQTVYEQVMGTALEKPTFRRKIEAQGFIAAVPGRMRTGSHRPAQLYRVVTESLREFHQAL